MPSMALLAHTDPHGFAAPHVVRHLQHLSAVVDRVAVVSSSPLRPDAARELAGAAELVRDTGASDEWALWRSGLEHLGDWRSSERLVLTDSVLVGPLRPLPDVLGPARPDALRGLTATGPHPSRHFLDLGSLLLRSNALGAFWVGVGREPGMHDRADALERHLARAVAAAGWRVEAHFSPTRWDMARARVRAARRDLGRVVTTTGRKRSEALASLRRPPVRLLDPAAAWWYHALDGRLPYVRLDTLVADPGRVGPERMLRALERAHPREMEDVRPYLVRRFPERFPGAPVDVEETV